MNIERIIDSIISAMAMLILIVTALIIFLN